ncbi:hypothetical protein Tco_1058951 [Tanacetum coccineum]
MSTFEPRECFWCGGPIYGIVCQQCNCERCGDKLQNEFCPTCNSGAGNSFAYDPNPNSFDDSQNFSDYPTHYEPILCDFCGNDARYGHYCTPQVPNPEPCYNQNYDEFPQTLPSFQQQILCCENCGGPHATFECQLMNQNFHDSNSSDFDQFQPSQFPVIHQPPQETSKKILQAKEDLMNSIKTFLKKFNRISFRETPKVLMQAWNLFFEIKHPQSEEVQELLSKLLQDLQSINEELAEYINTPSWNFPSPSYDDDDDEYSFATQEYLMTCSTAITPDSPKTDSLIMVDKHLDTIPKIESDEFIKSSVENLVQNPSESKDECECDVPDCADSQTTNFSMFSNPLFDDSTSSDDESSHEEVIQEMNFKTYSNPLFDLDEEINSSEFNPTHNEDLDSTPKDIRFDAESYLLESLANRDTLMASPPKIDFFLDDFAGELTRLQSIPPGIDNINLDPEGDILEEIDILHGPDDSIPPGIESDDFDSEDDDNSTSLPEFESFHVDYLDSGNLTNDVVEDILVDVPNIFPTHATLHMDFDFIPSHNDLESDLDVSSPSGDRNKIYDPGICIEVKSTRFLATLSPVIDTLIPFSSKNDDKVFNHGVLASKKKSPPSLSHRGLKASKLFHQKSPMLIHKDNTPNLGVRHPHFYPL